MSDFGGIKLTELAQHDPKRPPIADDVMDHESEQVVLCIQGQQRRAEQRSAPEIAEITGLPLNTVYSRVRAAKAAFQAEVARLELILRGISK